MQDQNLIHAKLPTLSSGKRGAGGRTESPVHAFVVLERYNAIKAIQFVHLSLAALSKVLRGTQLLTSDVQTVGSALINLEVTDNSSHLVLSWFISDISHSLAVITFAAA